MDALTVKALNSADYALGAKAAKPLGGRTLNLGSCGYANRMHVGPCRPFDYPKLSPSLVTFNRETRRTIMRSHKKRWH